MVADRSGGARAAFLGHYHQQLLAHVGRQLDAAQLYAPGPSGYVVGQKRKEHVAELVGLPGV